MAPMRLLNLLPRVSTSVAMFRPLQEKMFTPSAFRWQSTCCGITQGKVPAITTNNNTNTTTKNFHSKSAYKQILEDTDHPDIAKLLVDNKKWVEEGKNTDPNFLEKIGGKQVPKYLYIGCSDSRVPANEILGLGPGEVFVHRNVGNLVIGNDLSVLSVIEFAVKVLDVKHILVTGHYDCGAVHASVKNQDLGLLENWIRNIRDTHRIHKGKEGRRGGDDVPDVLSHYCLESMMYMI
mgnify:FL=1